jgi:Fur family peroxide stress response transcriptional regulator
MDNILVKEALEKLKEANIRITPQRYAILEYLIENHSHPTADEIYRALEERFPNMSVATVYNNLRLFTEIGFVQEMSYGDASSRFVRKNIIMQFVKVVVRSLIFIIRV